MTTTLNGKSYDELCDQAREASRGRRYAAVIEVGRYMSDSGPFMTVAQSADRPLKNSARRGEWRSVVCQFFDGRPYGWAPRPAAEPVPLADGELPF